MSHIISAAYMAGYSNGLRLQRKRVEEMEATIASKNEVIVNLSDSTARLARDIAELEEVNDVLQQNVDELTARMPSKSEPRDPYDFQVGDLVRHRAYNGKFYRIAAINPATHRAMFEGYESQGWLPLSHYFRVEA